MEPPSILKAINIFQQHSGTLHTSQALRLGVSPRTLYALRDSGRVVEVTRALRIPRGVICLISALSFHGLTTQIPHAVYTALPLDAERPRLAYPPVRFFWLSQASYAAGIEVHQRDGVNIRIYSREKTIADCFKYRNKIGLDVALEALKEALSRGSRIDTLLEFAKIDRVEKTLRPYLEALA
jgi:predicted transcriptional regulator of viral defense system